ncbi:MAG: VOC family protein [Burkholderiaceae bacterium]
MPGVGEGAQRGWHLGHVRLFYRHDGGTFAISEPIDDKPATFANGGTIGFKCVSPEQCRSSTMSRWPTVACRSNSRPGLRESTSLVIMSYVRDPDGNKLCALHRPK